MAGMYGNIWGKNIAIITLIFKVLREYLGRLGKLKSGYGWTRTTDLSIMSAAL
jgi:hypothetical protein